MATDMEETVIISKARAGISENHGSRVVAFLSHHMSISSFRAEYTPHTHWPDGSPNHQQPPPLLVGTHLCMVCCGEL